MALLRCTTRPLMRATRREDLTISRVFNPHSKLAEKIAARFEGHDDFLHGGVAGALADAVDGAFDLARPVADGGERIGHRQTEIVVAMDADDGLAGSEFRHGIVKMLDERAVLVRHGPAHGVGNVHGGRARRHHRAANLAPKIPAPCASASSGENSTSRQIPWRV